MKIFGLKLLLVPVLFVLFAAGPVMADLTGPTAQLRPVLTDLIAVLADESLKGNEKLTVRREKIMAVISEGFDFREMSRRVLGRTWNDIGPEEQDRFTGLMTKLMENVYIGKLETYSGQTVEYLAEKVKGERAQVSVALENNGVTIPIHYIMRLDGAKWMVYDINIEGVSLVSNYQAQFKSILRTENYEGLVKVIEEKNQSFLEGKAVD